jgi:hypothetical protein
MPYAGEDIFLLWAKIVAREASLTMKNLLIIVIILTKNNYWYLSIAVDILA